MTDTDKSAGVTQAARDVMAERGRQASQEGWTPEHDDHHDDGSLALAAALYATPVPLFRVETDSGSVRWLDPWPWKHLQHVRYDLDINVNDGDKRGASSRRRELVKAGALILAEIERLDRARGTS